MTRFPRATYHPAQPLEPAAPRATVHRRRPVWRPTGVWPSPRLARFPARLARALASRWIWLGPAMIAAVGVFDLACTLTAYHEGWLVEANPLARAVLERWGAGGLAAYRLGLVYAGCVLLVWGLRAYRARNWTGAARRRARAVVWGGQLVLILSHAALVVWWGYCLFASA
ncbi:MAG: hypothetical protein D6815_10010 [Candidatus Dadabacteria bacterium]|nr:MAG: hypothetical protein D6815_10010 [Candidatus Dadabacteria bacterium]